MVTAVQKYAVCGRCLSTRHKSIQFYSRAGVGVECIDNHSDSCPQPQPGEVERVAKTV